MRCKNCKNTFEVTYFNQKFCKREECLNAAYEFAKKQKAKNWNKEKKKRKEKLNPDIRKKDLQREINKLARMIDAHFNYPCIDCGKTFTGQIDGAHYKNVGGNENIRFNLHNIHSARGHCNKFSSEHKKDYPKGLIDRYGLEYYEMVENLSSEYSYLGLSLEEVKQALKKTRKLIREFDQHIKGNDVDGSIAREYFNKQIGIYE